MFGRKWVKKDELVRLEIIAKDAFKRAEPVCKAMQAEYGPKVEEKGYLLQCKPSPYADEIWAMIGMRRSTCTCPKCFPQSEVAGILPDSFGGYKVCELWDCVLHP